jgi:hypothetical protein
VFWVRIPSVASASDLELRCYYGNADATAQTSPSSTWNGAYAARYGMTDATTSAWNDSTANGRTATKTAANKPVDAAGLIARCQSFNGSDMYATAAASNSWSLTSTMTTSVWVKTAKTGRQRVTTFYGASTGTRIALGSGIDSSGEDANDGKPVGTYRNSAATFKICQGATAISDDTWHHLAWVIDGSNGVLYVDGASAATVSDIDSTATFALASNPVGIGKFQELAQPFSGLMDELRVSSAARAAAWIAYDCGSQKDNAYLTWGDEVALGSSGVPMCLFMQDFYIHSSRGLRGY